MSQRKRQTSSSVQPVEDSSDDDLEMEYETEEMLLEDKQQFLQAAFRWMEEQIRVACAVVLTHRWKLALMIQIPAMLLMSFYMPPQPQQAPQGTFNAQWWTDNSFITTVVLTYYRLWDAGGLPYEDQEVDPELEEILREHEELQAMMQLNGRQDQADREPRSESSSTPVSESAGYSLGWDTDGEMPDLEERYRDDILPEGAVQQVALGLQSQPEDHLICQAEDDGVFNVDPERQRRQVDSEQREMDQDLPGSYQDAEESEGAVGGASSASDSLPIPPQVIESQQMNEWGFHARGNFYFEQSDDDSNCDTDTQNPEQLTGTNIAAEEYKWRQEDHGRCIKCHYGEKEVKLIPCGHLTVCKWCFDYFYINSRPMVCPKCHKKCKSHEYY